MKTVSTLNYFIFSDRTFQKIHVTITDKQEHL